MTVLGTAGHVDHGKSTLVRALTGVDPDTLAAERERGLTIDLGFAVAPLPSGHRVHLVDVPGHVRFLKNMLAGAGAVSGAIFVVDALEGPRAQSIEHLRLLELLGVHEGVVVITKADLVSADRLDDATLETLVLLEGSPLADADPIVVDSVSGRGLDTLRQALDALVERIEKGNQAAEPAPAEPDSGWTGHSRPPGRAPSSPGHLPGRHSRWVTRSSCNPVEGRHASASSTPIMQRLTGPIRVTATPWHSAELPAARSDAASRW